jgi:uncharacterized small protein (DUF1192 family)
MNDKISVTRGLVELRVGADLSMLSIDELKKRITLLEQEISRIRVDIEAKELSKETAESIFRS